MNMKQVRIEYKGFIYKNYTTLHKAHCVEPSVCAAMIGNRMRRGWELEEALTKPSALGPEHVNRGKYKARNKKQVYFVIRADPYSFRWDEAEGLNIDALPLGGHTLQTI